MYEPVRKALFPGVLAGILCVLMMASLASTPGEALAATTAPLEQRLNELLMPVPGHSDGISPFDFLVRLFAPLVLRHDPPPPTPIPAPTEQPEPPKAENESRPARGEDCALGDGFAENVRRWCDEISHAADNHGLDPNLIAAVMTVESGGNADAYSRSGAVGLMQVMPRDGIAASFVCVNGPCFARRPSMAELYDPEFNLDYAGSMLAGLINKHGNFRDALFAYGPTGMGYAYADKVLGVYERSR